MDQSVLENLKWRYRKELLKKLLLADESSGDSSEVSCFDFWKRLTIKDAMYMVSDAWNDITDANIRAWSWKKLLGGDQLTTSTGDSEKSIPSHACEMLKECILWAEQQPETTGAHMISLCTLMGISAKKRMSSLKQTKIFFSSCDKCIVPL